MSEFATPGQTRSTSVPHWSHQPALDGLRTVAVYLVVLFHAGFAWTSGGFVGVDLFFVLSGFLVTNTLLNEHSANGRVQLRRFYARRVRRLLPASLVLVVVACVMSALVEAKYVAHTFVGDARAALLYVANWKFLGDSSDYFAADVHRSPFLHFWSLAIEEQFYFVFPLVFVGCVCLARRSLHKVAASVVGIMFGASLISQLVSASSNPVRAYYATDARVYQILAGSLLAVLTWQRRVAQPDEPSGVSNRGGPVSAVVGLVVLVCLGTIDGGLSASARGIVAMFAALLAILGLDHAFRLGRSQTLVVRLLSSRPLAYLGRISYGTYLWHWPLMVIARSGWNVGSWTALAIGGVGGTLVAAASHAFVESPIRTNRGLGERPRMVVVVGLATSVVVAVVAVRPLLDVPRVIGDREFSVIANAPAELKEALAASAPHKFDFEETKPPSRLVAPCLANNVDACYRHKGGGLRVTLIGDSNAEMLIPVLTEIATARNYTLSSLTRSGCPWQRGLLWGASDPRLLENCTIAHRDWYDTMLPALKPDVVILANVSRDHGSRPDAFYEPRDGETVASATSETLDLIETMSKRIVILEPLPIPNFNPTQCLRTASTVADCAFRVGPTPFPTERVYRQEADRRGAVSIVDYDAIACPFVSTCLPAINGEVVFRDNYHLSNRWLLDNRERFWQLLSATGVFVR